MFEAFGRRRRQSAPTGRRRVRLSVELLEPRNSPSGVELIAPVIPLDEPQPNDLEYAALEPAPAWLEDGERAAMTIEFGAMEGPAQIWTFAGRVTDENPEGLVVTFAGLPSLEGRTAVVAADGTFSLTIQLGDQDEGTVKVVTTNASGQSAEAWDIVRQTRE